MTFIVEVTVVFLDLRGTASARLASDRHRPTNYNDRKNVFGVLDVALLPFQWFARYFILRTFGILR